MRSRWGRKERRPSKGAKVNRVLQRGACGNPAGGSGSCKNTVGGKGVVVLLLLHS